MEGKLPVTCFSLSVLNAAILAHFMLLARLFHTQGGVGLQTCHTAFCPIESKPLVQNYRSGLVR